MPITPLLHPEFGKPTAGWNSLAIGAPKQSEIDTRPIEANPACWYSAAETHNFAGG